MKMYRFLDHTADIIIEGRGKSLENAFAAVARGMFDLLTADSDIESNESVSFEIESIDTEGLLVGFLSQLILLHETEQLVLSSFDIRFDAGTKLTAVCSGEKFTIEKHGGGTHVKAVSYHLMEIEMENETGEHRVRVLLDI